jgi:hypothetical protein
MLTWVGEIQNEEIHGRNKLMESMPFGLKNILRLTTSFKKKEECQWSTKFQLLVVKMPSS